MSHSTPVPVAINQRSGRRRNRRKTILALLVLVTTCILTGCWDAVPIEDRNIATGLAVDTDEEDGQKMTLTSLVISPNKEATERTFIITGVGSGVGESRQDRQTKASTRLLFGQLQVLLFGEEIAKVGISDVLDYFTRFPRISHTIHVALTEGRASDYLELKTNEHYDMGSHLEAIIGKATHTIPLPAVTLHEFLYNVLTPHHRAVLPFIQMHQDKPALVGVALFRGCSLAKVITGEDASVITILRYSDVFGSHPFVYQSQGETYTASMEGVSSRKVTANYQDGRWSFLINIDFKGNLVDKSPRDGLKDRQETQKLLESALARHLEEQATQIVKLLQTEIRLDALDLAKYALAKGRKRLDGVDWDEQFAEAEIKVQVKVTMLTMGEGR